MKIMITNEGSNTNIEGKEEKEGKRYKINTTKGKE